MRLVASATITSLKLARAAQAHPSFQYRNPLYIIRSGAGSAAASDSRPRPVRDQPAFSGMLPVVLDLFHGHFQYRTRSFADEDEGTVAIFACSPAIAAALNSPTSATLSLAPCLQGPEFVVGL